MERNGQHTCSTESVRGYKRAANEQMIDVSDVLNGTRVAKTIKTTISQSADLSKITFKGCTNVTVKV